MSRLSKTLAHFLLALAICGLACASWAQSAQTDVALRVMGSVEKPLSLSLGDLQQMPRKTVKAFDEHENKEEVYEGVLLSELLMRAGVPQGSKLRGAAMATYIEADGVDGYRVVFSIAETDSGFEDSEIIVADKMDGQPLSAKLGPLRLVVPHDKRPGRWVRMLQSIKVVTVP
jgi:DMSO/TMAO reductase YedYZ molybdopterin-dependent catalytic subunit